MNSFLRTTSQSLCSRTAILLALTSACILGLNIEQAEAASKRTFTLSKGRTITVLAARCQLRALDSSTTEAQRIRCESSVRGSIPREKKGRIVLRNRDQLSVFARRCFLTRTITSESKIVVTCGDPTPTPTPTITPTPTNTSTATPTFTPNASALLTGNQLLNFNTSSPSVTDVAASVTGVNSPETLVAIDRRPQNGMLYGLGYNATAGSLQLYAISSESNVAVPVGTPDAFVASDGATAVRIGLDASTQIGMDFNPSADRIRVVTSNGQNFRMNPNTGGFVDGDLGSGPFTGTNMDGAISGGVTSVQESAYTNSRASTAITTLYNLDKVSSNLCIQSPPNAGVQTSCLPVSPLLTSVAGFDIPRTVSAPSSNAAASSGSGLALGRLTGATADGLVSINLTNGVSTNVGQLGSTATTATSFALGQFRGADIIALSTTNSLIRFNSLSAANVATVALTGIVAGETVEAIDWRASNGQLFGLGFDSTNGTGSATLYRIDPQTGAATIVGTSGSIADGAGTPISLAGASEFGFDFNPTVDRIRVVTDNGLNFRLNPIDGTVVGGVVDSAQNGATTTATGAAYTNSFSGATVTTLYTLDAGTDSLYIQNPPNNGTQTLAVAITLSGSALNFSDVNGFDIPRNVKVTTSNTAVTSGVGYAVLTVGGSTQLYSINLVTGAATALGAPGLALSGLAVGQTGLN